MAFINTPEADADEKTSAMYASAVTAYGYLPNMHRIFGHRPEIMQAWGTLLAAIRANMTLRHYELVTFAAAQQLKSSYCMLAHGSVLLQEGFSEEELVALASNIGLAPIDGNERAIMDFSAKVVRDATAINQQDVDGLRACGLSDTEIFDITTAAAARCFFSKTLDGLGALPDPAYAERLTVHLQDVLVIGRPIGANA